MQPLFLSTGRGRNWVRGFALAVACIALFVTSIAIAQTFNANQVQSLDQDIKCNWARDRIITLISGPCESYVPPKEIRIGETFSANGKVKKINVIFADRVEKDFPRLKLKVGDWTCTAAESVSDIPGHSGKKDHTGTWLYVQKCQPLK
jgi:hypothetical protein